MREILFKGKRIDNGEWVEGFLVKKIDPLLSVESWFILVQEYDTSCIDGKHTLLESLMTWYKVSPETVSESTSLSDKNNKKIFEGDIVRLTEPQYETEWYAYVVFGNPYSEYSWGWNLLYIGKKPQVNTDILLWIEMEETGSFCEIIGNIHDNPEQLKEGAE